MTGRRRAPPADLRPGILSVWKPVGPTSHDLVGYLRALLPRGAKVGHAGTLDPFAEGVLPICVGTATRLADAVGAGTKTYLAEARLDLATDTLDRTGQVEARFDPAVPPDREALGEALASLVGTLSQEPPRFSAVRVQGRRAYELAREGSVPDLAPREITVHAIELVEYLWPRVRIRVECGRGTYVRSLARDLGIRLGVGGSLESLVRERVGILDRSLSRNPFQLLEPGAVEAAYVPISAVLPELGLARVVGPVLDRLLCGNSPGPGDYVLEREARQDGFLVTTEGLEDPVALARRERDGRLVDLKVFGVPGQEGRRRGELPGS